MVLYATYGQAPLWVVDSDTGAAHSPVVSHGPVHAAVAWYRNLGGLENDLLVRVFEETGGGVPHWWGESTVVNPVPAAPYPPAIVAIPGGFFLTWSDGDSPDFRLKGRFVRIEDPR